MACVNSTDSEYEGRQRRRSSRRSDFNGLVGDYNWLGGGEAELLAAGGWASPPAPTDPAQPPASPSGRNSASLASIVGRDNPVRRRPRMARSPPPPSPANTVLTSRRADQTHLRTALLANQSLRARTDRQHFVDQTVAVETSAEAANEQRLAGIGNAPADYDPQSGTGWRLRRCRSALGDAIESNVVQSSVCPLCGAGTPPALPLQPASGSRKC